MDHYLLQVKNSFTKKPNTKKNRKEIKIRYSLYMNICGSSFRIEFSARDYYRAKKDEAWKWHGAMSKDDGRSLKDHGRDFKIYSKLGTMDIDNSWTISKVEFNELLNKFERNLIRLCAHNNIELSDDDKKEIKDTFLTAVKKKNPFIKLI